MLKKYAIAVVCASQIFLHAAPASAQMVVQDPWTYGQSLMIQKNTVDTVNGVLKQYAAQLRQLAIQQIDHLAQTGQYTNLDAQLNQLANQMLPQLGDLSITDKNLAAKLSARYPGFSDANDQQIINDAMGAIRSSLLASRRTFVSAQNSITESRSLEQRNEAARGALAAMQTNTNATIELLKATRENQASLAAQLQGLLADAAATRQLTATQLKQLQDAATHDLQTVPKF